MSIEGIAGITTEIPILSPAERRAAHAGACAIEADRQARQVSSGANRVGGRHILRGSVGLIPGSALYAGSVRRQPDGKEYLVLPGGVTPVDLLGVEAEGPQNKGRTDRLVPTEGATKGFAE